MSNERKFRIALSKEAFKYYIKVSVTTAERLDKCFSNLESEPLRSLNIKALKEMAGKYRYRVGSLRVIYEVDTEKGIFMFLPFYLVGRLISSNLE